jgi:hypothetical protein
MRVRRAFGVMPLGATLLLALPLIAAPRAGTASGIRWTIPPRWADQAPRSMRVATYTVPAPAGGEAGECAVFAFGPGQGGTVDANIQRWSAQFEGGPAPQRSTRPVGGLTVHLAQVSGTYLAPGGPQMQSQGKRPGYKLLGAIVEGPGGLIFFKLTGPAATVAAAQAEFDALLASIVRG